MTCDCGPYERLMCINVGDRRLREKERLLLVGSCMISRYPEIVREFEEGDGGHAVLQSASC